VHSTDCIFYLLYVNGNAKKVVFVVKQYAVRKFKVRPYPVRKLKTKEYALRKGRGGFTLNNCMIIISFMLKLNT